MSKQVILTIPNSVDLSTLREMKLILRYYKDENDLYEYLTDSFSLSEAKGDLISRSALKETTIQEYCNKHCALPNSEEYCSAFCPCRFFLNLIDNAPTIETYTEEDMAGAYNEGYACGSRESERPKGER